MAAEAIAAPYAVDVDEASRTSLSPANVRSAMPGLRHQEGGRRLAGIQRRGKERDMVCVYVRSNKYERSTTDERESKVLVPLRLSLCVGAFAGLVGIDLSAATTSTLARYSGQPGVRSGDSGLLVDFFTTVGLCAADGHQMGIRWASAGKGRWLQQQAVMRVNG